MRRITIFKKHSSRLFRPSLYKAIRVNSLETRTWTAGPIFTKKPRSAPIEPYFTSLCKLYFPSADDCNLLSTQWASIFSILCAAPLLGKSWATYDRARIRNGSRLFGTMHIAKTKTFSSAENFPLRIFDGMCLPIWHLKGNSFRAGLKTPGEGAELRNEIYLNAAFFFLLAFCFAESITRLD